MNMVAPPYVCVDVLSDSPYEWISYYTLHMNMVAPPYECVDVISDWNYGWMSYYTLHMNMVAPRMYALMWYQIELMTECLITHFTWIWSLPRMYAWMWYQTELMTECLITHFTWIWSLPHMYASMCYQTALLTKCFLTHFTWIRMLVPVYIRGISAFSILYLNMFVQSTLVKTQSLHIRIYSDSNKNYFYNNV
jgi:hypothetical protein